MTFAALWGDPAKETLLLVSVYFFRKNWGWPKVPSASPYPPPQRPSKGETRPEYNCHFFRLSGNASARFCYTSTVSFINVVVS